MTLLLAWARAHWKPLAWYASIIALSFASGWMFHRPPPAPSVALREDTSVQKASTAEVQTTDEKGAARITTTAEEFAPLVRAQGSVPEPPDASRTQAVQSNPEAMHAGNMSDHGPLVKRTITVEERGPEIVHTQTVERVQEQERQQVSLTVTPQPLPRWALGAGLDDPLGSRKVNLSIGFRLIGPVWLRAGFTPARGTPGATIGAEVQW